MWMQRHSSSQIKYGPKAVFPLKSNKKAEELFPEVTYIYLFILLSK